MNKTAWICLAFAVAFVAGRADACDMAYIRSMPRREDTRAVGVVVGYSEVNRPTAAIAAASSVRIRIKDVVSGKAVAGEAEVVPLLVGPDCSSIPQSTDALKKAYPVGMVVAVSARSASPSGAVSNRVIVVESNHGGFVTAVVADVTRTAQGDLDFVRFDWSRGLQLFVGFEFDRAVLAAPRARKPERFARLLNLAHFRPFADISDGRQFFNQLITESGVTASQGQVLLKAFDETVPREREQGARP